MKPLRMALNRLWPGFLVLTITATVLSSCGKGDEENTQGDIPVSEKDSWPYPNFKGADFKGEKNFAYLMNNFLVGKATPSPWVGYWWPYSANGIAAGKYTSGSSPAGKYDAARGGTTNAQGWEVTHHGSGVPKLQGWWGHCNGWTAASALFPEPKESVRVNGIEFGVADIKALLTEAAMEVSADFYGERVDWGSDYNSPKYWDTVPDQYLLVLTNYMGRLKQGVLVDRYTLEQIWNQPLEGYKFEYPTPADYLGADPQAPGVYRILVTSTIWWGRDDVTPDTLTMPFNFESTDHFEQRTLKMEVWLDGPVVFGADGKIQSSGNVIVTRQGDFFAGGAWKMGDGWFADAWPDYMWVPYSVLKPTDYANPNVDIEWIKAHLLVPGGADDTTASPRPIVTPPPVSPTPGDTNNPDPWPTLTPTTTPTSTPTPWPTGEPNPWPTIGPTVGPTVRPTTIPTSDPTFTPGPEPTFRPTTGPGPAPAPTRH